MTTVFCEPLHFYRKAIAFADKLLLHGPITRSLNVFNVIDLWARLDITLQLKQ